MEENRYGAQAAEEAARAFAEEDYERAAELFGSAAAADPADTDAAFFAAVSHAMQDGAEYGRIAPVGAAAEPAIRSAAARFGTGKAYYEACRNVISAVIDVTSRHYGAVSDYCKKERKKHRRSEDALSGAESLLRDCAATIGEAAKTTVGAALEHAEDLSEADEFFWDCVLTLLDNADAFRVAAEMGKDPEIAELFDAVDGLRGNVFGEYTGVEELPEDEGEYVEVVCPGCGETLSFSPAELSAGSVECPFCGAAVAMPD
ncbi:MAG: hypothetical protein IJK89_09995 [Clostridia bacterium]|nr:hypothetical protein [Clostridia bacterium]